MTQTVAKKDHLVTHTEVGICLSEFSCLESGLSSIETSLHLQLQIDCTWGRYYMLASLRETVIPHHTPTSLYIMRNGTVVWVELLCVHSQYIPIKPFVP